MSSATPHSRKATAKPRSRTASSPPPRTRVPHRAALAGLALVVAGPLLLTACSTSPADTIGPAGARSGDSANQPSATGSGTATDAATLGRAGSTPSSSAPAGTASAIPAGGCSARTPSAWGRPVRSDSFSRNTSSPAGWSVYKDTTSGTLREPSQVKVSGGSLKLIGTTIGGKSVSGGVSDIFAQKYGRWEACVRADKGDGYYPAITLWPPDNNWPTDGEIDLLESVDGNRQRNIFYVHNNPGNDRMGTHFVLDLTRWNEFAVDWTPDSVVFWVDGVKMWTMDTKSLVPHRTVMHMTFQNDAQNAPCRDSCRDASTPAHPTMYVTWMKAYKYRGEDD